MFNRRFTFPGFHGPDCHAKRDGQRNVSRYQTSSPPRQQSRNPAAARARPGNLGEVIFEFSAVGNSVKVCAVDPGTGTEVVIVGPVNAGESALRKAAMAKLSYVLEKDKPQPLARQGTFA